MTDWKTHDGGPQPIANDIWVEVYDVDLNEDYTDNSTDADWPNVSHYRILNQHLIDAKQAEIDRLREKLATGLDGARLAGIRLGLEAAAKEVEDIPGFRNFQRENALNLASMAIRDLDPTTIAREATLDTLTAEAQANNMGYDNDT